MLVDGKNGRRAKGTEAVQGSGAVGVDIRLDFTLTVTLHDEPRHVIIPRQ